MTIKEFLDIYLTEGENNRKQPLKKRGIPVYALVVDKSDEARIEKEFEKKFGYDFWYFFDKRVKSPFIDKQFHGYLQANREFTKAIMRYIHPFIGNQNNDVNPNLKYLNEDPGIIRFLIKKGLRLVGSR